LLQQVFAPNSPELASTLQFTVQAGLQQWLGDLIEVRQLQVSNEEAILRVQVTYAIRKTNDVRTQTFERSSV